MSEGGGFRREGNRVGDPSDQRPRLWFIGHAHIDAVWLWTLDETLRVVEGTFKGVLELMEKYPWLTYAQSSAFYYEMMEKTNPDLFWEIKERVAEGRWDIVGGSWVEFDANMPSGESLARQFLYGQRYFKEKFGRITEVGWLPDSFGYPVTLPQIMVKSGIKYFYTQKPLWNDTIHYPYHVFYWESPDGSRVLAYLGLEGYSESVTEDKLGVYVNGTALFKAFEGFNDHLILFGAGDHGGGPRTGDTETISKWLATQDLPAEIRPARSADFFKALAEYREIPVFGDELYLQYHRGVLTTQSKNKWLIKRGEVSVSLAERFSTIASLFGHEYPRGELKELWKKVLLYQFHDSQSGTCIREVYEGLQGDLEGVASSAEKILGDALKTIVSQVDTRGPGEPVVVFNPLSWGRREGVKVEPKRPGVYDVVDEEGDSVPVQVSADGKLLFVAETPSLGYRVYWLKPSSGSSREESKDGLVTVQERGREIVLENAWVRVTVDRSSGVIKEVYSRELGVNMVGEGGVRLRVYEDNPVPGRKTLYGGSDGVMWDAWEVYIYQQPGGVKYVDLTEPEEVGVVESGPLRGSVRVRYRYRQEGRKDTVFTLNIAVDCVSPSVKLGVEADWNCAHRLAKLVIPSSFYSEQVVAGSPFGHVVRRNPYSPESTLYDRAKYEAPFQGWVSHGNGEYGVSVVSNTCRGYGFTGRALEISLLRAARYPPRFGSPHLEWFIDREYTDQGLNTLSVTIYPHRGDWRTASVARRASEDEYPLIALGADTHGGSLPHTSSFLEIGAGNVVVTALKMAEDDDSIVIRLYEANGSDSTIELKTTLGKGAIAETNILELEETKLEDTRITLKKYEVKTLKIHKK